jgi:competence protein ComEA
MTFLARGFLGLVLLGSPAVFSAQTAKAADQKKTLVDINSASAADLKAISGIGDAYSAAIIKNRPYKRKDELVDKKVLPQGVYDKVKDQIVARQK